MNRFALFVRATTVIAIGLVVSACQTSEQQGIGSENKSASKKTSASSGSEVAEKLDESALEKLLEKNKIKGVTAEGETTSFEFSKFGHTNDLFVKRYDAAGKVVEYDRGSWWIVKSRICRRLQNFYDGTPACYAVQKTGDNYQFLDKNNKIAYRFELAGTNEPSVSKTAGGSAKMAKNIGIVLGYSDLCQEFHGNGVENVIARDIKQHFAGNMEFEKGYNSYSHLKVYDTVTGLTKCASMNKTLRTFHKVLF